MNFKLHQTMKIFITGVSSGLGHELTKRFLVDGHQVWGISRCTKEDIDSSFLMNSGFLYSVCDIRDENRMTDVANKMVDQNFIPDVIILNAASRENDFLSATLSISKFKEIFNVNFWGSLFWVVFFLPFFQKRNKGKFIVISSLSAKYPLNRNKIAYSTSKAALNMLFESLKLQLSLSRVRFTIFNFGRLGEKKPFLAASYKEAAKKVLKYVYYGENSRTVNYPLIDLLAIKIIQFLPPRLIKKYIIKGD